MADSPLFSPVPEGAVYVEPVEEPVAPVIATDEPPVVETPAADPIEEPVVADAPQPTTVEVIKEVEKIVEKYPEMDEYTSEIFKALMEGNESELLTYLSEKHKDYKTMSDYDAVKEGLRKANPTWSNDDLDLKIEVQYGDLIRIDLSKINEEKEPEEYAEALAHNAKVDRNAKVLKLDALNARASLDAGKKEIKLPKITKNEVVPEPTQTAAEIEQGRLNWEAMVDKEMPELKEFTFKVGDDKTGYEDVSYAVTDKQRSEEGAFMKGLTTQSMFDRLGWVDKTGKQNVTKMAGDVLLLANLKTIIASAYTQGVTAGGKGIKAEIKNIDLSTNNSVTATDAQPDIGMMAFGHLNK